MQEKYDQSRHTGSDMNTNTEGYVESTPTMNDPGGLSVAGDLECHTIVFPYYFDCLGLEVADLVMQLVNELFVNDDPELQHGGKFVSCSVYICCLNHWLIQRGCKRCY